MKLNLRVRLHRVITKNLAEIKKKEKYDLTSDSSMFFFLLMHKFGAKYRKVSKYVI